MARCPAYRNFALPLSPSCRYATFLATLSTSDSSFKNWILGILGTVIAAVLIFVIEQRLTRPPPPPPGGLGVTPGGVVIHPAVAQYVKRQDFARQQDERSEEHTSELQSRVDLVCRLLLEKKKKRT